MKKISLLLLFSGLLFEQPLWAQTQTITVINQVAQRSECRYETNTVTVFGANNVRKDMNPGDTTTITIDNQWGGLGVQDNGWYWRTGNDCSGQNPDNAGMQVYVGADCTTPPPKPPEYAPGKGTPDARQLITVAGSGTPGKCTITLRSKTSLLPVTKDCCGPGTGPGSCVAIRDPQATHCSS